MAEIAVKIRRLRNSGIPLPRYQSAHAAGLDIAADLENEITLASLQRAAVPTGIAIELPPGFEAQVRPRSGRALSEGLTLVNSPGTIDADYRGEINVLMINLGSESVVIRNGDRIAQLVIAPVTTARIVEAETLSDTKRGEGGFGHTGR